MKIYVNGKYLITRLTGVQRVAIEMVRAMRSEVESRNLDVQIVVLEPPAWIAGHRLRPLLALLWEQIVLPVAARDGLLLSLCNTGPVVKRRHAIVLHDAAVFDVPENYGRRYGRLQRALMALHARRAGLILTVSRFSRGRLAHWLHIAESRIRLLGIGVEHIVRARAEPVILDRLALKEHGYLLAIGSRQPGKNFGALLQAAQIARLPLPIVIVGGADVHVFGGGELVQNGHLIDAGYVSDGELVALLRHAHCYVQPSLYEGFGLPVIEAMALGIPVLCARAASLPEVCGDDAIFFDPTDPADIARVMSAFLADDGLRSTMSRAGMARASTHTWQGAAARLLEELKSATP